MCEIPQVEGIQVRAKATCALIVWAVPTGFLSVA